MATNIVLADAAGTPVNHTFVPIGRDANGVYWFEDQSAANQVGNWRISVAVTRPPAPDGKTSSDGRSFRTRIGLHEPILETLSNNSAGLTPAPTVAYVSRSFNEFVVPERATLQNRKDIRKMAANLLAEAQITAVVENLTYLS